MSDKSSRADLARQNFLAGYSCSQAVILAFEDLLPLSHDELSSLASSFGGGMGRLREVCGAFSACNMVLGLLYGYSTPETGERKAELYARVQALAKRFEAENGSIVCREILGLTERHSSPVPTPRTADFYQKRPCPEIICGAAALLEAYIAENPIPAKEENDA